MKKEQRGGGKLLSLIFTMFKLIAIGRALSKMSLLSGHSNAFSRQ